MDGKVHLTLEGEDLHIERDIDVQKVPRILDALYDDDTNKESKSNIDEDTSSENEFELTDDVKNRLSDGQEALIQVLLYDGDEKDEGWVTGKEIAPRMEDFGRPIDKPRDIGGVRKGMTQKFGKDNDIIGRGKKDGETAYRLNPDYRDEFRDHFNR